MSLQDIGDRFAHHALRSFPRKRESSSFLAWPWVPAFAGTSGTGIRVNSMCPTQYDFGMPSTFSAMKLRIICGLTGAMRVIKASRRYRST